MPKSKVRKRSEYVPAKSTTTQSAGKVAGPSPAWYPIVVAVVLVLGLAWIATYYIAGERVPVMEDIGAWNFAVGFGLMVIGLVMAVRWR